MEACAGENVPPGGVLRVQIEPDRGAIEVFVQDHVAATFCTPLEAIVEVWFCPFYGVDTVRDAVRGAALIEELVALLLRMPEGAAREGRGKAATAFNAQRESHSA